MTTVCYLHPFQEKYGSFFNLLVGSNIAGTFQISNVNSVVTKVIFTLQKKSQIPDILICEVLLLSVLPPN